MDEIHQVGIDRYQFIEDMKSAVTSELVRVNRKYGAETIEHDVRRWIFFSNYLDAIPMDDRDR